MESITKPTFFKYEDFNIYPAEEVLNYDPVFFKNHKITSKNIRDSIEIFNLIENNHFILLAKKKESWFKYERKYPKAKLFLTKEWVENNIPKFKDISNDDDYECPPAPDILELNDNEKFKDTDGNVLNIEVRGIRSYDKCYFKVKDISKEFEAENLHDTIIDKRSLYDEDIDYGYFSILQNPVNNRKSINKENKENKEIIKKELYLTYNGMTQFIIISRNKKAKGFKTWMIKTLFTVQMGTIEDKQELASSILGIDVKTVKRVLSSSASNLVPCLYLLYIGKAKDILINKNIEYNDDEIICKFGRTIDLKDRITTHSTNFKKKYNTQIELLTFSIIDPDEKNLSEAEAQLHNYFIDMNTKIKLDDYNEIIKITKKQLDRIKQQYKFIQNLYKGKESGHEKIIEELNKIIEQKEHQLLLKDKDIEIIKSDYNNELIKKDKDIEIIKLNFKIDIKDKDLEIMRLKTILLQNNIKIA